MNIRLPRAYLDQLARNQHGCFVGYARDSEGQISGLITLELFVADGVLMTAATEPMATACDGLQPSTHGKLWRLVDLPGSPLERTIDYNGVLIALDGDAE